MHRPAAGVVALIVALSSVAQFLGRLASRRILAKAAGKGGAGDKPGLVVLTQARYILIVACLAGAATVAMAVGLAFDKEAHSVALPTLSCLLIGGGLTLLLGKETRLRIEIDAEGVRAMRPWRGPVRFGWTEVEAVLFSPLWQGLVIRASDKREVIVPPMVVGTGSLIDAVRAQVAPAIWTSALVQYDRARSRSV